MFSLHTYYITRVYAIKIFMNVNICFVFINIIIYPERYLFSPREKRGGEKTHIKYTCQSQGFARKFKESRDFAKSASISEEFLACGFSGMSNCERNIRGEYSV